MSSRPVMQHEQFNALKFSHRMVALTLERMITEAGGSVELKAEQIAEASGISTRTVRAAAAEITQRGIIQRILVKEGQAYRYEVN